MDITLAQLALAGFTIFLGPTGPDGRAWRARRKDVVIHSTGRHTPPSVAFTPPGFTVSG